jgi:hypothetical protein
MRKETLPEQTLLDIGYFIADFQSAGKALANAP